ncbi:MAG: hypothetical protein M1833_007093 [Piccolia ochrophora]|nr:MAG: hypothetical protein M1833_007093 [Piccolia ochrophora]
MAYKRSRASFEEDLQAHQSPFVVYGTALPPLDPDVRDDGSYVPVWKQEVTDDRGRKRLHGAFTGGFSAGYFNTVGSKEGWTPTAFVSSRSNRNKDAQDAARQRAEDFMDEEDLADAAEAQRLQTSQSFSALGSTEGDEVRQNSLIDLLKKGGETMGVKLLRRMGWREGQGVGPKIRRKARLDRDMIQDTADVGDEDMHLFAPENSLMITFNRKNDHKGVGFEGESRLGDTKDVDSGATQSVNSHEEDEILQHGSADTLSKTQKKKTSVRGGFGVGILNDTGSDDEDPYSMGPRISYNKTLGGDKKKKKRTENGRSAMSAANPLVGTTPRFISKKAVSAKSGAGFRKCHDGYLPLDGFVLSNSQDGASYTRYRPPEIPKDWKSSKAATVPSERSNEDYQSTADVAKASSLNPSTGAKLLGEAPLPSKSVFDFLSQSARDRVAAAAGKPNLPAGMNEAAPKGFDLTDSEKQKDIWALVPALDDETAIKALGRGIGGWMPYAEDEAKRTRYRSFLELKAGLRSDLPIRSPNATTSDWTKELHEFAHAAQIFKPMTGMMASRFTSSSSAPKYASDAPEISQASVQAENPAEAAAKIGMYGPMTRSMQQFYPSRLLCKRFNVRPPEHVHADPESAVSSATPATGSDTHFQSAGFQTGTSTAMPTKSLELVSKEAIKDMMKESRRIVHQATATLGGEGGALEQVPKRETITVNADRNEALEKERPGEAVFKAIFGSDDEDDAD